MYPPILFKMSKLIELQERIKLVSERAHISVHKVMVRKRKRLGSPPPSKKFMERAKWGPAQPDLPINMPAENSSKLLELSAEVQLLREKLAISERNRKLLNDHLLELKGRIRIYCRVKPSSASCVEVPEDRNLVLNRASGPQIFVFDKVFTGPTPQSSVFEELKPYIQGAIDGEKVCLFTYGQTGSGKTYTIEGTLDSPGLLPRAGEFIFESGFARSILISCFELYMDNLSDLLTNEPLKLQQTSTGLQVTGLTQKKASSTEEFMQYFNTASHNSCLLYTSDAADE